MGDDKQNSIDVAEYSRKETYTAEEKKIIMDRLDKERRINQKALKGLDGKKAHYTEEEKKKILDQLNEQRLSKQKRQEIRETRTKNKEIYTFGSKTFYKFKNTEREYYIQIEDCDNLSSRPSIISLYYKTFDALHKKDVLMKVEVYSDKFFISYDAIRVYFKSYALEDAHKK